MVLVKTWIQDLLARDCWQFFAVRKRVTVATAVFLLTLSVIFIYRPLSAVEDGDSSLYDYIAQCIVRGQTPYRDVIEIKAPGSFYLSALAMQAGKELGIRDFIAARLLQVALTGVLSAVVFLVAEVYLRSRFAALLAVLTLLTSQHVALWSIGGEPKLPMMLFGMLSLLLIAKDRTFYAGFCSMLSCLCWQPGLLFTGVAFLVASRYFTTWRDLRALKVLAGAAIPLATLLLYFRSRGALGDLWTWTVVFNYSVYSRKTLEETGNSLGHVLNVVLRILKTDIVIVGLSLIGFVHFGVRRFREKRSGKAGLRSPELFRDAIVIAPLVYLAACLIRFNAGPYLIPFFPFIGMFFGWFIVQLVRLIKRRPFLGIRVESPIVTWFPTLVLIVLLSIVGYRAAAYRFASIPTLQAQELQLEPVSRLLANSETIYVHGSTEILVLLNRVNLNPYVFLDSGKDDFIAAKMYGGSFQSIIEEMESKAPRVVALSRLQRVIHRWDLRDWVERHYDNMDLPGFSVYVRKSEGSR